MRSMEVKWQVVVAVVVADEMASFAGLVFLLPFQVSLRLFQHSQLKSI